MAISNGESQLGFPDCRIMLRQHLVQLVNIARLAYQISLEFDKKQNCLDGFVQKWDYYP